MTNEEARAAKARAEAATPGPWTHDHPEAWQLHAVNDARGTEVVVGPYEQHRSLEFIAAARTDVPALVDDLLEARAGKALALEAFEKGHALIAALEHDNALMRRDEADLSRRLSEMAKLARREHVGCSCHYACIGMGIKPHMCDCGADDHNAKVEELLNEGS